MPVVTRSRAAAQRGLNSTSPNANVSDPHADIRETAMPGAVGNRKPARGRRAKAKGAQAPHASTEAGDSASAASRTGSKTVLQSEGSSDGHVSQPRNVTQTISQTCGLYVKVTFQQVETTSNTAGSPSQQLHAPPPEANGVGAKKPRKGRRATTKRGPKAKAKTGRPGQPTETTSSTARAGTKRRREDDEYQPGDLSDGERDSTSVTRTLRRVRRKTEKATASNASDYDAVDEAVNRTRRSKGKARAVNVPTTEEASVGSKRRRDEEDADAGDASQSPLDPGPSRRTTRRTRQRTEVQTAEENKKKATRKPRGRRTNAPAHSPVTVSRASTPLSCESEEPTFVPSPAVSTEIREVEERPAPQEVQPEVLVKQEEATPSLSLCQPTTGSPAENPACNTEPSETEPSELLSPLMLPGPLILATTPWHFARAPSESEGSIIKAEDPSSPALDRDISQSPGGSDKENEPTSPWIPRRGWSVPRIEDIPPLSLDSPDASDDDDHPSPETELGSGVINADLRDDNPFAYHYVVRSYPRRPLEPLEIVTTYEPEDGESEESETISSDDRDLEYPEEDARPHVSALGLEIDSVQHRASPVASNSDNPNEADVSLASTREDLGDPRRCSSNEFEELLGAPSSPCNVTIPHDVDRSAPRESESLVPPDAEPATRPRSPSSVASVFRANGRNSSPYEESFTRSNAPSPSPFPLVNSPTPERSFSLPPCQCGNPARHFVVHSDGEASEFSFMGDDEDF